MRSNPASCRFSDRPPEAEVLPEEADEINCTLELLQQFVAELRVHVSWPADAVLSALSSTERR